MIKIAVVDDEKELQKMIKQEIESVEGLKDYVEVVLYDDAESLLSDMEKIKYDIVFSDIKMRNMLGIELGKNIREKFPSVRLIFLTAYMEYAVESYLIEAYQYILKEQIKDRLPNVLRKVVNEICEEKRNHHVLKKDGEMYKILYEDIIYIKKMKSAKYIQYVTKGEEFVERR